MPLTFAIRVNLMWRNNKTNNILITRHGNPSLKNFTINSFTMNSIAILRLFDLVDAASQLICIYICCIIIKFIEFRDGQNLSMY